MKGIYKSGIYASTNVYFRFEILEMLGSGTFGQVAKCRCTNTGQIKAVKIIKNKPAYIKQSKNEVKIFKQV
jgi:dual specificity protein kinase YAK1